MAPAGVVTREMEQDLPPGLLRFVSLAVALEAGGGEEQPPALALEPAPGIRDQPFEIARSFGLRTGGLDLIASFLEREPGVVCVARRDPALAHPPLSPLVGAPRCLETSAPLRRRKLCRRGRH